VKTEHIFGSSLVLDPSIEAQFKGRASGLQIHVMSSDLRALSRIINKLFKYADDTTLFVPQYTDVSMEDEFQHLERWASTNKMIINRTKTKELVFRRPDPRLCLPPIPMSGIEHVTCMKLLGVYFSDTLHFDNHVKCSYFVQSNNVTYFRQYVDRRYPSSILILYFNP